MSETAIDILKEAVQWLQNTPEGRAIAQVDGQPGSWMNKALTLIEINPQDVSISRQNLDWLTSQVKEYKQFRSDAEIDIGYLQESVWNLQNVGEPTKLIMKLISGRLDIRALGLDPDRLEAIAKKYAPAKYAELKQKEDEQSKKKK